VKRKLAVLVVVVLALVLGLWLLVWPRPHRINQEGFDWITEGMTQREVEEILGRPPGDYSYRWDPSLLLSWRMVESHRLETWISDDGIGLVEFNEDARVVYKRFDLQNEWPERPWKERVSRALDRSLPASWRAYFP
jgi:hypothetical protein